MSRPARTSPWRPACGRGLLMGLTMLVATAAAPAGQVLQGWTATEQELWWNGPQGSRLLPHAWFLALDQADGTPFADPAHLARYGFLPGRRNALNPDGLPVGFARERDRSDGSLWVGLTCAACHTREIGWQGRTLRIEGGGGFVDMQRFDRALTERLAATATDDRLFQRFAERLQTLPDAQGGLRSALSAMAEARAAATAMNTSQVPHGPGRYDLVGAAMNGITAIGPAQPGNSRSPDAPIRIPALWGTPGLDRTLATGAIANAGAGPLVRNVLAVRATPGATGTGASPAAGPAVPALQVLQALVQRLRPLAWPADVLPPIDRARADRGQAVFDSSCAACHARRPDAGSGPITLTTMPVDEIGTDPRAARLLTGRVAETGALEDRPVLAPDGPRFGPIAPALDIVVHVAAAALEQASPRLATSLATWRNAMATGARLDVYLAPPLDGIWARAPYLHNGSVPNMAALLTPPAARPPRFAVSGDGFDPVALGLPTDGLARGPLFDAGLPGNSNGGHDFGTALTPEEKAALIEFLKSL